MIEVKNTITTPDIYKTFKNKFEVDNEKMMAE